MDVLAFLLSLLAVILAVKAIGSGKGFQDLSESTERELQWLRSRVADLTKRSESLEASILEARGGPAPTAQPEQAVPAVAVAPPEAVAAPPPAMPLEEPAVEPVAPPTPPAELLPAEEAPVPPATPPEWSLADEAVGAPPPPAPAAEAPAAGEPKEGWERRLGILAPVWVGAIALALAGAFLVKYSVEQGLLGPGARVTLATILGIALLVVGERLRRRSVATAVGASAAGIAVLYAAFLGGAVLYKLISPWLGFALLVLVTATAVVLSLRQGIVVAAVGLVGGFLTPFWIGAVTASPAILFAYLLTLQAGLLIVTRRREWTGLSTLTLLAGLAAAASRIFVATGAADAIWIGLFLLASAAAFVITARGWETPQMVILFDPEKPFPINLALAGTAILGATALLAVLAVRAHFALEEWAFLAILGVGSLVLARLDNSYQRLPWAVLVVTVGLILGWVVSSSPGERESVWLVTAGLFAIFGVGGWLVQQGPRAPAQWTWLSACAGLAAFGLAWWVDKRHGLSVAHWGVVALGLAVPYLLAALRAARRVPPAEGRDAALAGFAVAVTAFVSLTVPLELAHEWLAVAWALEVAALAWLFSRLHMPVLAYLGMVVTALVAARLLVNPGVVSYPIGTTPVLNWILYGYGIPLLAFAAAAYLYWREGWRTTGTALAWGSAAFAFALLTLEVRHAFHPGGLVGPRPGLIEWSTYSLAWLLAGLLCLVLWLRTQGAVFIPIAVAFFAVAGVKIVICEMLAANPLLAPASVGGLPVLNWLLYVYALPALATVAGARLFARAGRDGLARVAAWSAGLLAFAWLTLAVRHGFHPPALSGPRPSLVEWATYSHAWLAAALLLVAAFRRWGAAVLLHLARVFTLVAMAKLLIVDLALVNPLFSPQSVGTLPLLNWLLYVYGVPLLALVALGPVAGPRRAALGDLAKAAHVVAIVLAAALASLQVRQFFHGAALDRGGFTLAEVATYGIAWMALSAVLLACWRRWSNAPAGFGAQLLYAAAVAKILLFDMVFCNPILWHQGVGPWPVLNALLYVYAVPIVLLALAARLQYPEPLGREVGRIGLYGGLVLGLLLLTLQVRQLFHGSYLDVGPLSEAENYTYSAAWILFALLLLAVGIARGGKVLRIASLVVVFLAVSKVFLYDLRQLRDLYRVLSFLGLGMSLLLISYLYQRFVFSGGERANR